MIEIIVTQSIMKIPLAFNFSVLFYLQAQKIKSRPSGY
jgi:hypothetical protein